jgi:exodeoxyribonuclease VII large subunit
MAARIDDGAVSLQQLAGGLTTASRAAIDRRGNRIAAAAGRLHALSPVATLARGYAIAQDGQGRTLASIDSFVAGSEFELLVRDGIVQSTANAIVRREDHGEA